MSVLVTAWIALMAAGELHMGFDPVGVGASYGGLWVIYVIGMIYIYATEPK